VKVFLFLHQFRNPSAGGTEVYGATLARALRQDGHDTSVVTVERDPARPDYTWSREETVGFPVFFLNIPEAARTGFDSYHDDPVVDLRMQELLERERPEAIHLLHLSGLSTGWLERLPEGPRVVMTLADHWLYCARGQLLDANLSLCSGPEAAKCAGCLGFSSTFVRRPGRWESGTARIDNRWLRISSALRRVDTFVSPSADTGRRHVEAGLVPKDRLVVRDYGFELPAGPPPKDSRRRKTIGFAGTLMYSKGVHVLLEAFAQVKDPGLGLQLIGAWADYHGQGGYRERCAKWLADSRVKELGPVPHGEIPARLAAIDLLVVPSLWPENSPLIVHEAMLAGVPVAASDTGGLSGLVVHGENGFRFPPGDVAALARLIGDWAAGRISAAGAPDRVCPVADDAAFFARLYGEARRAA